MPKASARRGAANAAPPAAELSYADGGDAGATRFTIG